MGGDYKNAAVMTALGAAWKQLGEGEKARFNELAAQPVPE
jgi:Flp pilus assembly protein TadD